ncbi:MAG: cytidylate kinase family protein [Candidatus Binatia bacterium]
MAVIAMTQEMGSLGKDVALQTAEALGLTVVRDEMISDLVAGKMKKRKSALRRFKEGRASMVERLGTSRKSLAVYSAEEVYDYASKGDVLIRGWGATYLLRTVSHVLRVRVCAPFERRVQWLMERLETDNEKFAQEEIHRSDVARSANIRHWFQETWGNPLDYDLVLNTGRVSIESCVELIKLMVSRPEMRKTEESQRQLLDLALESKVRTALQSNPATVDTQISIEVDDAKIVLSGIVVNEDERRQCESTIAKVPGVKEVANRLTTITGVKSFR